jgi:hypothetical protein
LQHIFGESVDQRAKPTYAYAETPETSMSQQRGRSINVLGCTLQACYHAFQAHWGGKSE